MRNRNRLYGKCKLLCISLLLMAMAFIAGCSKDNDGTDSPIKAGKLSVNIEGVNNCNGGTILAFSLPYTASEDLTIKQLNIKTSLSNGSSDNFADATFTDSGSTIGFSQCTVFGTISWVDYEVQLQSVDGTLSNFAKVRVNKPSGAN